MTQTSGPFDFEAGVYEGMYQNEWEPMARVWSEDAVVGDQASPALQVYASGSGARLRAGDALVRGFWYRNSAEIVHSPTPNADLISRLDRFVLRLDRAAKRITAEVLEGIPGAGPPALEQSDALDGKWEMPLGGYRVESGTDLPTAAWDDRWFQGLRVWRPSSEDLLPATGAPLWQPAVLPDGRAARWNGGTWAKDVAPTAWAMGVSTAFAWPPAAQHGLWWRQNGLVQGAATTSLSVSPPSNNLLSVTFPGGLALAPGTYVGHATLANSVGAVKNHGFLLVAANGVEATLHSFTAPPVVAPENGDTVTAEFRFTQQ